MWDNVRSQASGLPVYVIRRTSKTERNGFLRVFETAEGGCARGSPFDYPRRQSICRRKAALLGTREMVSTRGEIVPYCTKRRQT